MERNVLFRSFILPLAQTAFVCVCVLRTKTDTQTDGGKATGTLLRVQRKTGQRFYLFLHASAGDAGQPVQPPKSPNSFSESL